MTVFTSTIANTLKETIDNIVDDDTDGLESNAVFKLWMDEKTMSDNFEDDLEMGGPGLAQEKAEDAEIATGTMSEGYITRYIARTFGQKMIISEEAMEDAKYPRAIALARKLKRSLWKTADYDATNVLVRGWNSSYTGGDGVCLFSSSHTLPNGGTFSNTLATPLSPSVAAVAAVTTAIRKLPGHDSLIEGAEPTKIVCPVDQWAIWSQILNSNFTPTAGNFAEINVAKNDLSLKVVPIKYWSNTTTNWAMLTDVDNGLQFRWRRRPKARTWVDNDHESMKHSISARWARGWSDPRCAYGSQA